MSSYPQFAADVTFDGADIVLRFRQEIVRLLTACDVARRRVVDQVSVDEIEQTAVRQIVALGVFFDTFGLPNSRAVFDQMRASAQQSTGVTFRVAGV